MKGFTKGKGSGKKFIPTTNKKKGLKKSDIDTGSKFTPSPERVAQMKKSTRERLRNQANGFGSETRKKQSFDKLPEDFSFKDLLNRDKPHNWSDADINHHAKKHELEARKLAEEISDETPEIKKIVTELNEYHKDAVRDGEELLTTLENKNHNGNSLPLEYLDIESTEINNYIRDWSNVTSDEYGSLERQGNQNQVIISHLSKLKQFHNKLIEYDRLMGETFS